ncbi:MAG: beta-ribofuranosylaminobenzene 5'-phosphate synthase family protein [Gammaproteobacteria bacterium]
MRLCVKVEAPARLHLGFMDLNGGLGRRFGGIGLTIEGVATRLSVTRSASFSASGPEAERALEHAQSLLGQLRLPHAVAIRIFEAIPSHVGLGSGTQLALAVGTAIARLYDLDLSTREIGQMLNRGERSGVGIGSFDMGGFVVDGGRGRDDQLPPVTARLEFPARWRVVLVHDCSGKGLHGAQEIGAFEALPEFPAERAAHLCRLVLMQILPAVVEAQLPAVGRGINELQTVVGDYFAPAQGGRFASPEVAQVLAWFQRRGVPGVGQSSWGPTGFALIDDEARAQALAAEARANFDPRAVRLQVVRARNYGSLVERYQHAEAQRHVTM